MKRLFAAAAIALGLAGASHAAVTDFNIREATPGGSKQVYDLGDGSFLLLFGISGGATAGDQFDTSDLLDWFAGNQVIGTVSEFFYSTPPGTGAWAGSPEEFEAFGSTFEIGTLNSSGKLFDSFWARADVGTGFTFDYSTGGRGNFGGANVIAQNPLDTPAVPLPAAAWMLIAGLGGLVAVGRRSAA